MITYIRRAWAVMKLFVLFNRELFLSSYAVLVQIIRPRLAIRPGIVEMKTRLRSNTEITLLSCLICLTPGTLTLDVAHDGETLYIHAMDIEDAEELAESIRNTFERAIMEVTRA
ncbi:Na+/H+ antiporter subunit E [Paenibacillus soyae]|uniref:Na+/H+ antiporter subunit E n=1 Tax=Paenibacillus soyae TaxID=2969249 RepID=UPI0027D4701A|nr:Na+/H+ antiporter subunit E [Paenibacillus soyae]